MAKTKFRSVDIPGLVRKKASEMKVSDKELFGSDAFQEYLQGLVTAQTKQWVRPPVVQVVASDPGMTAATNGTKMILNRECGLATKFSTRNARFKALTGMALHETAHCVYSNFSMLESHARSYEQGVMPARVPDLPDAAEVLKAMDGKYRPLFYKLFTNLQNIIMDAHDENCIMRDNGKFVSECIMQIRYGLQMDGRPIEEAMAANNGRELDILLNCVFQLVRFGEILALSKQGLAPVMPAVKKFNPVIKRAVETDDTYEQTSAINEMVVLFWPYIKEQMQKAQQQKQQQSGGSQQQQQGGSGQQQENDAKQGRSGQPSGDGQSGSQSGGQSSNSSQSSGQSSETQSIPFDQASLDDVMNAIENSAAEVGSSSESRPANRNNSSAVRKNTPSRTSQQPTGHQSSQGGSCGSQSGSPGNQQSSGAQNGQESGADEGEGSDGESGTQNRPKSSSDEGEGSDSASGTQNGQESGSDEGEGSDGESGTQNGQESGEGKDDSPINTRNPSNMDAKGLPGDLQDLLNGIMQRIKQAKAEDQVSKDMDKDTCMVIHATDMNSTHKGRQTYVKRPTGTAPDLQDQYNAIFHGIANYSKLLQRNILNALRDLMEGGVTHHLQFGRILEAGSTYRPDQKFYAKKHQPEDLPDMAVSVLVDLSASMHGPRIEAARKATILLYDFCNGLGIPCMVAGHNNAVNGIEYTVYTDFNQVGNKDRLRLAQMAPHPYAANRDGMAIEVSSNLLSKRPERIKMLIIISDGQPYDQNYGGEGAAQDIRSIIGRYRRKGIETFAAAIGTDKDRIRSIYGEGYIDITDLQKLPKMMTNIVKKRLLRNVS